VSHMIDIDTVDKSGLLRETAEAAGIDRRDLLRKGAIGAGGVVAASTFFGVLSPAHAAISTKNPSKKNDVKILQFAMTLELLEADFYAKALEARVAGDNAALQKFNEVVADHELKHVAFLRKALGSKRVSGLEFDFGNATTDRAAFQQTAQVLEDVGVSAYAGQGPNLSQKSVVEAALSIHSVEARHAAWIRFINTGGVGNNAALPAPATFDRRRTERQVLALASPFIAD